MAAAGAVALAAFWLLLWLAASDGGKESRTFRRLASAQRRLAAASDEGPAGLLLGCLPTAVLAGAKAHGE